MMRNDRVTAVRRGCIFAGGLAAGLAAAGCTAPPNKVDSVAGCYQGTISPLAGSPEAKAAGLVPPWVRLGTAVAEGGMGYRLDVPDGVVFPVHITGAWFQVGRDSVHVRWASHHPGVSYNLKVERNGLRGTGRLPQDDSTWAVFAGRVPCREG